MEHWLHTSLEDLARLVTWVHSHALFCSVEGLHGNLIAAWQCKAGHTLRWVTATCTAGSPVRGCSQGNTSFLPEGPSTIGEPSGTQTSPRKPARMASDGRWTRDSSGFSHRSEPSELDEARDEDEDESIQLGTVRDSSAPVQDSSSEPATGWPQSAPRKTPGAAPSSRPWCSQVQMAGQGSKDVIRKKIKQEIPDDSYSVANAELTGRAAGPALSLTQMAQAKPQAHAGPCCVGSAKPIPAVTSAIGAELDPPGVSASSSAVSRPGIPKTARLALASPNRGLPGAPGTSPQVAVQMSVSTSHPVPLCALQLPGQDEQVASRESLPHLPSQGPCEVTLSPSVSSSQQQPPVAPAIATEATAQGTPGSEKQPGRALEYEDKTRSPYSLASYNPVINLYYLSTFARHFFSSSPAARENQHVSPILLQYACRGFKEMNREEQKEDHWQYSVLQGQQQNQRSHPEQHEQSHSCQDEKPSQKQLPKDQRPRNLQ
ncbi:PREDICTED: uncharacterized protein KIAA1958-like [Chinchilla lanigera]|uniref:uncharacterized protein KIAA1958-like n=1 Tax=Chinchilla lanigera TaxID=34839 RepID=UPI0006968F43|nr:PREDICTED: uncharacterized protein KIAA1958-like [Chinchilla lanigera]